MSHPVRDAGLAALTSIRNLLYEMLDTIPDGEMLRQPAPGANHPLWIIGHLAVTDDQIRHALDGGGIELPERWIRMFGTGSTPADARDAYPSYEEMRKGLSDSRQRFLAWVDEMSDAKLDSPVPEDWQVYAPTFGTLVTHHALHEAIHVGQLTVVRRSLGLSPVEM